MEVILNYRVSSEVERVLSEAERVLSEAETQFLILNLILSIC